MCVSAKIATRIELNTSVINYPFIQQNFIYYLIFIRCAARHLEYSSEQTRLSFLCGIYSLEYRKLVVSGTNNLGKDVMVLINIVKTAEKKMGHLGIFVRHIQTF